eukprot:3941137-Rhodomonas_salina.4
MSGTAHGFVLGGTERGCVVPGGVSAGLLEERRAMQEERRKQREEDRYTPNSNTRNRISGTNCTEIAVSCIGFRNVGFATARLCAVLRWVVLGHVQYRYRLVSRPCATVLVLEWALICHVRRQVAAEKERLKQERLKKRCSPKSHAIAVHLVPERRVLLFDSACG